MDIWSRSGEPGTGSCREVEIVNFDGFNCLSDFANKRVKEIEEEDKAIIGALTDFERKVNEGLQGLQ